MTLSKFSLEGKVAIITGGGTGLGEATCLVFAEAGADIVVAARRQNLIERTAEAVRKLGRRSLAIPTDATKSDQVQRMVDTTITEFGRIDILANCVGVAWGIEPTAIDTLQGRRPKEIWEWQDEDWHTAIDINLTTAFACARAVVPHMIKQKKGSIINFSSGAGIRGLRGSFTYCSSKAGIIGLTKCFAVTWARNGIRANCIVPGFLPNVEQRNRYGEELLAKRASFIPMGRIGEPREAANVVLFLASDASEYITGECFFCDGAAMAAGYAPTGYAPIITL